MLKRWERFACFVDDGRICLTHNAAERALRGFALERTAVIATLIMTAKLNDIDTQAWRANVLARIAETQQSRLAELLP